jgi:hypothetical protein
MEGTRQPETIAFLLYSMYDWTIILVSDYDVYKPYLSTTLHPLSAPPNGHMGNATNTAYEVSCESIDLSALRGWTDGR